MLRQRNFALLWFGGSSTMVGDWVLFVGFPFEIYRETGSTLATGGMIFALLVPRIAFGSIAGVYVDRWDRRRLMVGVNLLLAAFLLPPLAVESLGLWIVYLVLVVESTLEQLFTPAEVALVPNLLEGGAEQLVPANALSGVNRHLARLLGPLAAGLIAAIRYVGPPLPAHPSVEEEGPSPLGAASSGSGARGCAWCGASPFCGRSTRTAPGMARCSRPRRSEAWPGRWSSADSGHAQTR